MELRSVRWACCENLSNFQFFENIATRRTANGNCGLFDSFTFRFVLYIIATVCFALDNKFKYQVGKSLITLVLIFTFVRQTLRVQHLVRDSNNQVINK